MALVAFFYGFPSLKSLLFPKGYFIKIIYYLLILGKSTHAKAKGVRDEYSEFLCSKLIATRRVLGGGWLCGSHRSRAAAATTRHLHAYACEGADENSWQSRPRHARASRAPHCQPPPCTRSVRSTQPATVMSLLDASAIARNVGRDQVFAASRRAACLIPTWSAAPTALQTNCLTRG
jgi:hypothetical protein